MEKIALAAQRESFAAALKALDFAIKLMMMFDFSFCSFKIVI